MSTPHPVPPVCPTPPTAQSEIGPLPLVFGLAQILQDHFRTTELNVNALTRAINLAAAGRPGVAEIHRNTIEGLLSNPDRVHFTAEHLRSFHYYLEQMGFGLDRTPLLGPRGVLAALARSSRVVILLGARPHPKAHRTDVTHWDNECSAGLVRALQALNKLITVEIQHVILGRANGVRRYEDEEWYRLIERDDTSLLAIGSPRACLGSEVMLAKMFGVRSFAPGDAANLPNCGQPLPFRFIWGRRQDNGVRSTFAWNDSALVAESAALRNRVRRGKSAGLWYRDELHEVPVANNRPWTSWGVIAAQRRPGNHVWAVLGGVSGPMTLAAGRLLPRIMDPLPAPSGQGPRTLYVAIRARLHAEPTLAYRGDNREMSDPELVPTPGVFP